MNLTAYILKPVKRRLCEHPGRGLMRIRALGGNQNSKYTPEGAKIKSPARVNLFY